MGLVRKVVQERAEPASRGPQRDYATLMQQLGDGRAQVRRWAAKDLAAHPEAAERLAEHLAVEPESIVREALFGALVRIGGDEAVAGVVPLLGSDDAELRNGAIEVLKNLPADTAGCIESLLRDPDPDVRILAINVLESLRHPRIEEWLLSVLASDAHENVCATAIDLLGEVGTAAAIPALEAVRERFDSDFTHFACDLALRRIGAP
jgi:HEAT repeat protein